MTIKELKDLLSKYPDNAKVHVDNLEFYYELKENDIEYRSEENKLHII